MGSVAIDHMFSLIVFMAAIVLFIGIFNQSMSTAVVYEQHKSSATKTSDLLDTMLLNPGLPINWSQRDDNVTVFGLQDPAFSQYKLSPFSFMRLTSNRQSPVCFSGAYYSNLTAGFGSYILTPSTKTVNYSRASELLGVNGTYGFQLTLTPTVTVSIEKTSTGTPLEFLVSVAGTGSTLANANISYSLLLVQAEGEYPSYTTISGTKLTDQTGLAHLTFTGVNGESQSYALVVYAYLYGLKGMGYYVHVSESFSKSVVPLVDSFADRNITIAHSDSVDETPESPPYSQLNYSASYVILTEGYTLRPVALNDSDTAGRLDGSATLTVPVDEGILIITYKGATADEHGIILVPWGLSALAYPVTFGGNPEGHDWVTTDIRQVTIGDISYQAKLALWRLNGVAG